MGAGIGYNEVSPRIGYTPQAQSYGTKSGSFAPVESLTHSLQKLFPDSHPLPTMDEFTRGYKQAYIYHHVNQEFVARPKAEVLDGVVGRLSKHAGYTPRSLSRWEKQEPYIKGVLDSVKPNSKDRDLPSSDFVKGLADYRNAVHSYIASDPFHLRLEAFVRSPDISAKICPDVFTTLQHQDISPQVYDAPLQAQMYAAVDRTLAKEAPYKDSQREAMQSYLALAAFQADYDTHAIKKVLGKENSSTSVARIFDRAGLDFHEMQDFFTNYGTMWRPELATKEDSAETMAEKPEGLPTFLFEKLPSGNC